MESLGVGTTSPYLTSLLCDQPQQGVILSRERRSTEQSLESLGVGTTSPYLTSLLRDQTQQGLFSREEKEAGHKKFGVPGRRENFPIPHLPAA